MPRTAIAGQQIGSGIGLQHLAAALKSRLVLAGPQLPTDPQGPCLFVLTEGDAGLYLYTPSGGWRKVGKFGDAPTINGIQFRYGTRLEWTNDGVTWRPARSGGGGVRYVLAARRNEQLEAWGAVVQGQNRLGQYWHVATWGAPWASRDSFTSVVTSDSRMWVMGGQSSGGATRYNDVWYSSNGSSWTQAASAASWPGRYQHTSVRTPDGKKWVLGGYNGSTPLNDVWFSTDGSSWTQATSAAGWAARYRHSSVATTDGRVWVLGGFKGSSGSNDVWYSTDGSTWTQATSAAGWTARHWFSSVTTPDGKVWIMGGHDGSYRNDVWYSTNGSSWTQVTSAASWAARRSQTSIVTSDGRIWLLGGWNDSYCNDVWYSSNGSTWTQATSGAPWTARAYHASVCTPDGRMWVIGGHDNTYRNDVWYSSPSPVTKADLSDYRTPHDRAYEVFKPL